MDPSTDSPLTLRLNRWPMTLLVAIGASIALLGLTFAVKGLASGAPMVALVSCILVVLGAGALARACLTLRIDEQGVRLRSLHRQVILNWSDMESVVILRKGKALRLGINFFPGHARMTRARRRAREGGAEFEIPATFGDMGAQALQSLLERHRRSRQPVQWLRPEERFGLALSAIHADAGLQRHDCLSGMPPEAGVKALARQMLVTLWNVHDATEALVVLRWLDSEGHARHYQFMRDALRRHPHPVDPLDLLSPAELAGMDAHGRNTFAREVRSVIAYGDEFPHIAAWDGCRLIALARTAFAAGYLSEADAWRWVLGAARTLGQSFASWEALSDNYMAGRDFWGGDADRTGIERHRQWLLKSKDSPWYRQPWPTQTIDRP